MTETEQRAKQVEDVLKGEYFDYRKPLRAAWEWTRSGKADQIE